MVSSTLHSSLLDEPDPLAIPTATGLVVDVNVTATFTGTTPMGAGTTLTTSSVTTPPSPQIPSSTTQPPPQLTQSAVGQSRLMKAPVGAIIGGVVGGLVFLAIVVVLCLFWRKRKQRRHERQILTDTNINSAHPDPSETTTGFPRSSQPLASSNSEIGAHHNALAASALPRKRERQGPMDAPQINVRHGEPSDEIMNLGDQADAISGVGQPEMAAPDIVEEVRLLRVLIRAIENRHQLTAVVADEDAPTRINANDNVDPPPEYEDY